MRAYSSALRRDADKWFTGSPTPHAAITDSKMHQPSALPVASSQARSGCGIRPTTFRVSLQMPAMLLMDPFGLAVVSDLAPSA